MDALSKQKKDEYATAFAILALYDGGAEVTSEQIGTLLEATGNTEVEAFYPIIFANFLNDPSKIAQMIASPGAGGGGMLYLSWDATRNLYLIFFILYLFSFTFTFYFVRRRQWRCWWRWRCCC